VLGLAPDDRGLLPEVDVARLKEFGEAIGRTYSRNLTQTPGAQHYFSPEATDDDPDTVWRAPARTHQAEIKIAFNRTVSCDRAVAMEWLPAGQLVEKYRIDALVDGQWKTIHTGATIGHKKIDIFPRVTAKAVRLVILSAAGAPRIREFAVYDGGR